ncbi:MAG: hypothetical protein IJW50_04940 [Clostridia bacterium]|nr:hypothetical protein [Clostridia bacterium]
MTIRSTGENAYFAASNSVHGFCSYYEELFGAARIKHVYAVKGGPGTGKSRFLRDVADRARGEGWTCEYIYCSSDPDSLDGIILSHAQKNCIALLDATAPHVFEPTCPGAREELLDLGAFWDAARLGAHVEEIERLNLQKKEAYRRAYRYLAGLGEMSANVDSLVAPFVKRNKIVSLAQKLLQDVPDEAEYAPSPALIHSIGMRGEVGFDTYFCEARRLYVVEDCRGVAQYLMAALGEEIQKKRLAVRISHDPVEPHKIDGFFLCKSGIAVAVCRPDTCEFPRKKINARCLLDTWAMKNVRGEINYAIRMCRAMRGGAIDCLEKVRELHFRLEEIYSSAMDFEAKEVFTQKFCDKIFI